MLLRIGLGLLYTYAGLVLFLCGVNVGFTRTMASPTETHTPMDRARPMARWEMEPLDTSSTCLVRTATAGPATPWGAT